MANLQNQVITDIILSVDSSTHNKPGFIYAKQYDINSRFLRVKLVSENGVVKPTVPASLNVRRYDGEYFAVKSYTLDEKDTDAIIFELTKDILALPGNAACDVSIGGDGSMLTSSAFHIIVAESSYSESAWESVGGDESNSFTEAISAMAEYATSAAQSSASAKNSADSAEANAAKTALDLSAMQAIKNEVEQAANEAEDDLEEASTLVDQATARADEIQRIASSLIKMDAKDLGLEYDETTHILYPTYDGVRGDTGWAVEVESGVDSDELIAAVNAAIAEAKANGEFDGKDGESITIKSVSESTADGGNNVITFSDGKTLTVKNGSKGSDGAPGKDGEKGADGVTITRILVETNEDTGVETNVIYFSDGQVIRVADGEPGTPGVGVGIRDIFHNEVTKQHIITFTDGSQLTINDGKDGANGEDGKNYVLTDADKAELSQMAADTVKIPTALKNPNALTINGTSYDGSSAVSIDVTKEPLVGTTAEITPTQVAEAVAEGRPVAITHATVDFGEIKFCYFVVAQSAGVILSTGFVSMDAGTAKATMELYGYLTDDSWEFNVDSIPQFSDIPTIPETLPNPNALTINGTAYDGSRAVSIDVGAEPLIGTTSEITPAQVVEGLNNGKTIILSTNVTGLGNVIFNHFLYSGDANAVFSTAVVKYGDELKCAEIRGKVNSSWVIYTSDIAQKSDLPTELKNPNAITFTGAATGSYDGSAPKTINIPVPVSPDFAANSGEPGHIMNRTHYTDGDGNVHKLPNKYIDAEWLATKGSSGGASLFSADIDMDGKVVQLSEHGGGFDVVFGDEYDVYWNETLYRCAAKKYDGEMYLGNGSLALTGAENTGEPFCLYAFLLTPNTIAFVKKDTSISETVSLRVTTKGEDCYNKMPVEYLPDGVAMEDYVNSVVSEKANAAEVAYINSGDNESIPDVSVEGGTSIDVVAEVGQTIVVEEVDGFGKPTKWRAADFQERTHWEEGVVEKELFPLTTFLTNSDGSYEPEEIFTIKAGALYKVVCDGAEYILEGQGGPVPELGVGEAFIANFDASEGVNWSSGAQFMVVTENDRSFIFLTNATSNTMRIAELVENVHKIPTKFVPTLEEMRGEKVEILTETTVECADVDGMFCGLISQAFSLEGGKDYVVKYNGTEYVSKCLYEKNGETDEGWFLGNLDALTGTGDNGMPFVVFIEGGGSTAVIPLDGSTRVSLAIAEGAITKIPTRFIPTIEEMRTSVSRGDILPETAFTPTYDSSLGCTRATLPLFKLELGKTYTVLFDGVEYNLSAFAGTTPFNFIAVGNTVFAGGENTGESFAVAYLTDLNECDVLCMDANEHTVQVIGDITTYHKIPSKYVGGGAFYLKVRSTETGYVIFGTPNEIDDALNSDSNVILRWIWSDRADMFIPFACREVSSDGCRNYLFYGFCALTSQYQRFAFVETREGSNELVLYDEGES